jgi:hypothetical protein
VRQHAAALSPPGCVSRVRRTCHDRPTFTSVERIPTRPACPVVGGQNVGIWIEDVTGKTPAKRIFDRTGVPTWSGDGKQLVISTQEPSAQNERNPPSLDASGRDRYSRDRERKCRRRPLPDQSDKRHRTRRSIERHALSPGRRRGAVIYRRLSLCKRTPGILLGLLDQPDRTPPVRSVAERTEYRASTLAMIFRAALPGVRGLPRWSTSLHAQSIVRSRVGASGRARDDVG